MKIVCKNCGYRFEAEKMKKCPYCNKEDLEEEQSAEELVEGIDTE